MAEINFEKYIEYFNEKDVFAKNNNIKLIEMKNGESKVLFEADETACNAANIVHGGAMFTAMDVAAGNAVMSFGNSCVTLNGSINYIRAGQPGRLTAEAKVVKLGRQIAVSDVDLFDEQRNLLCHGTFTMFITKQKKLPNQQ